MLSGQLTNTVMQIWKAWQRACRDNDPGGESPQLKSNLTDGAWCFHNRRPNFCALQQRQGRSKKAIAKEFQGLDKSEDVG